MHAEFIAVGTELLLGDLVNTNAALVARELAAIGIRCRYQTVVGDDQQDIVSAMRLAVTRAPIVLVSGGLGPTEDDLTREAAAEAFGRSLRRDPALEASLRERFASFGRPMPERNVVQADVLEGARIIPITWGTAPGQILEVEDALVVLVPGVPGELEDMFTRVVREELAARAGAGRIVTRTLHFAGLGESTVAERLRPVWDERPEGIELAYLAGKGEVRVRFTARGRDEADALSRIEPVERRARELLGDAVLGSDAENLDRVVADALIARGWTLAAAESLTGGGFGERCTRIDGASRWFRGSLVTYATDAKTAILGVPEALIEREGVVSVAVARAMAEGARAALESDIAVALTGVAGPSEQGRDVGTVCIAVRGPGIEDAREVSIPGDRARVRHVAATRALTMLERALRDA